MEIWYNIIIEKDKTLSYFIKGLEDQGIFNEKIEYSNTHEGLIKFITRLKSQFKNKELFIMVYHEPKLMLNEEMLRSISSMDEDHLIFKEKERNMKNMRKFNEVVPRLKFNELAVYDELYKLPLLKPNGDPDPDLEIIYVDNMGFYMRSHKNSPLHKLSARNGELIITDQFNEEDRIEKLLYTDSAISFKYEERNKVRLYVNKNEIIILTKKDAVEISRVGIDYVNLENTYSAMVSLMSSMNLVIEGVDVIDETIFKNIELNRLLKKLILSEKEECLYH